MNYVPHTNDDRRKMLESIGVDSIEALFAPIPPKARLGRALNLPPELPEHLLLEHLESLAGKNLINPSHSFLGAGAYRHYIPSVVDGIISRSEYMTAYTPYQPEVSQGTLQTIFEFQSLMCGLTGMDVANASVYDGGCAAVDGVFMALGITGRPRVLVSEGVNPQTRELLSTYLMDTPVEIIPLDKHGQTALAKVDNDVACVVFQEPNFLGVIEDGPALCAQATEAGALSVVAVGDPVSLAVLKRPGHFGADIVVGDAQPLGLPPSFGGPYAGFVACKKAHMRRIPGRLCGMTVDGQGRRGYCLTLQAREQHIRREKAFSNICTNQGLCALAVTVHLALIGPQGLREMALSSMALAAHFKASLPAGFSLATDGPTFHEVLVRCPMPAGDLNRELAKGRILGGYPVSGYKDFGQNLMLFCFTETNSRAAVDQLVAELARLGAAQLEGSKR